ncbi:hypothetical protein [Sorangium sp. So ce176]|uniref:hypothetical protein n=1 Tax=Sorangium sp. So ce176 TaxID=3133286 RepID=UPI003F5FDB53
MRRAIGGAFVLAIGGCDSFWSQQAEDCELLVTCDRFYPSGPGGGPPGPMCDADPTEDASTVSDTCAVFASANAEPGGDGTKARPYASLAEAVANANGKRVLACTSGAFAESVTIEAGVEVIGGFDCDAGWTWSEEARSAIEGPADQIALTLEEGARGAKVRSFAVRAAGATKAGGSSIGVAVADVEAELAQVEVTAGDGMDGADGMASSERPHTGASGSTNTASFACIMDASVYGGDPGVTICEDGETRGGQGGTGGIPGMDDGNGQPGQAGTPLPDPIPDSPGLGGIGQTETGECEQGQPGRDGAPGSPGPAGRATTLALTGITGGDGAPGSTGKKGQGGGGGGGAKAGYFCGNPRSPAEASGASGGGGGAGGCGGKGGGGGQAGGSSTGILSLGTKLVLAKVIVAVGKAGNGGGGGFGRPGASGGHGGTAGPGSSLGGSGCDGGRGGTGGRGGPGGGGRGGHAVGIAYAASPGAAIGSQAFTEGTAGNGGSAGLGGPAESDGMPGASGKCWDFAANASCGQ